MQARPISRAEQHEKDAREAAEAAAKAAQQAAEAAQDTDPASVWGAGVHACEGRHNERKRTLRLPELP